MLKKSIFLCLLSSSLLAGIAFSQDFMFTPSIPTQNSDQDKTAEAIAEVMQEAPASTPASPAPLQLDRSGVDRASVHLQILQQSNQRFTDNVPSVNAQPTPAAVKKTASDDKKSQAKSASST